MPSYLGYCGGDTTIPYHSRDITTAGPYYIGYDSLGRDSIPNTNYNGWISEVRIWNSARSASEVADNINTVLSPQPGLVGYYLLRSRDTCQQYIEDLSVSSMATASVTLDGSSSTGTINSYAWSLVSGPNTPVIANPASAKTQVTGLIAGTYVFQLAINGDSSGSQVSVYVNPESEATANAGNNQAITFPASSATLNGSGSTGSITSYLWSLVSGPNSPLISNPDSASTGVVGLIPGSYVFRLSVNDGSSTSQVTVAVLNPDSIATIFTTQVPANGTGNDGASIELGVKFKSSRDGYITGIRFYKTSGNDGTHIGELYSRSGARLAQATFTEESDSGWQTVLFDTAVAIQADTTYLAAYFSSSGNYTSEAEYFISNINNEPLTGLADGADGANGMYSYTDTAAFPTNDYQESNYWVDVMFADSIRAISNAGSDQIILPPSSTVTLSGSGSTGPITSYLWSLVSGPNSPAITSPAAVSTSVTGLIPGSYVFRLSVNGGSSTSQATVDVLNPDSVATIFTTQTPANGTGNDGTAIELGVKFKSSQTGYVTGVRFYKTTGNSGIHIGELYNRSGIRLARATFTGESNSGWQTVFFNKPVAIKADTTYLAAYFSSNGNYTSEVNYFTSNITNGPLTGLADGVDGANGLYGYTDTAAFPTNEYQESNYWVDVVFTDSISATADAGANQTVMLSILGNNAVRGTNGSSEASDPVWLSGSQISFTGADPIGVTNSCACHDTATTTCDNLSDFLSQYKSIYLDPAAGYVDLYMRTFAGNITPAEGPKGVFDVNGNLIGNTVDSTTEQVNASFAAIWNSSPVDKTVGTLTALSNGKFRLQLKSGQKAPCNGVTGMRYYQFDAPVDTLDAILCGYHSYIDFGDGIKIKVNGSYSDSVTNIYDLTADGYGYNTQFAPVTTTVRHFMVSHIYPGTNIKTVTVYHPDIKGVFGFDNYNTSSPIDAINLGKLKNLRGYMPQETKLFTFHSTQDSTFNTSKNIKNFDQVSSIVYIDFLNGQNGYPSAFFKNNHFGSFTNNKHLKLARLDLSPADSIGRPVKEYLPDLSINFPELNYMQISPVLHQYTSDLDISVVPKYLVVSGFLSSSRVDSILIEKADGSSITGGILNFGIGAQNRTSTSDNAVNALTARNWTMVGAGLNLINSTEVYSWTVDPDSIKVTDAFTDFINQKLGTSMSWNQVRDFYYQKCGVFPDCCSLPTGPMLCPDAESVLPVLAPSVPAPCADSSSYAAAMATNIFTFYSDSLKGSFDSAYVGKCLQAASKELLTLTDSISEYHYTLYYYDQAGNLVKTVPPAGVVRSYRQSWLDSVKAARTSGTLLAPSHTLTTNYRYNTLNTMIAQSTPDAGHTSFWYDRLGRLVLSQNAKQFSEGSNYSYTLYDPLSRITEVGQINSGVGAITTSTTKVPASWNTWLGNNATNRYQVTNTVYDLPATGIDLLLAQNPSTLRNRVSFSSITPGQKGSAPVYSTYYNYDIEGNVSSLLQDYGATGPMHNTDQQYKRIDYGYDLVSGKVNSVSYQPRKPDAFMYFYRYDAENRLTDVYTTADSVTVEHEAHYEYYKHGPLARALIGQNQVQGLDYAYTLQGWLKAVNGSTLDSVNDMGRDGDPAVQSRKYIAKDAYGFSLHYFEGDYQPINGTAFLTDLKTKLGTSYRGLYNGNISSMAVNIGILNNPKLYNYRYDQLNRLTGMDMLNGTNNGLNLWTNNLTPSNDYTEKASYDPNGNILTYIRHGYGATPAMDSMTYHYEAGTNKLNHIADGVPSGKYPNDLDNQSADNYTYDAAGNLITDQQAGITTDMTWSVYGKLLTIPSKSVSYTYDAAGNRIGKTVGSTNTWYVRDAEGNILTTYSGGEMTMQERDLYGSSRLGTISNPATLSTTTQYLDHLGSGTLFTFTRGTKLFELTNHLGNVLATISDKKFGTAVTGIPSQIAYYTADVKSAQDYYPGGMLMPGRKYSIANTNYRYGFNGQEKSTEINGSENLYTAQFWEYDSRIGRRWNMDPKPSVGISPYAAFANNPIFNTDPLGDTIILRNDGRVISNDKVGNGVYVHHFKDNSNNYIGEIGGKIDANEIYGNLLSKNIKEAKGIYNPFTFKAKVTDGGDWDLKVQKGTIWGLGNDGKTTFSFEGKSMESQDIGNHHFGAVAKAALGYLLSEKEILTEAGNNQIGNKRSKLEWQPTIKITKEQYIEHGMHLRVTEVVRLPPYGDDPRDQQWIQSGFEYYKQHK